MYNDTLVELVAALIEAGVDPAELDVMVDVWTDRRGVVHLRASCARAPRKRSATLTAERRPLTRLSPATACRYCHSLWRWNEFTPTTPSWIPSLLDAQTDLRDLRDNRIDIARLLTDPATGQATDQASGEAPSQAVQHAAGPPADPATRVALTTTLASQVHRLRRVVPSFAPLRPVHAALVQTAADGLACWVRLLRADGHLAGQARREAAAVGRDTGQPCLLGLPEWGSDPNRWRRTQLEPHRFFTRSWLAVATLLHFGITDPAGEHLLAAVPGWATDWLIDQLGNLERLEMGDQCDLPPDRFEVLTHLWPENTLPDAVRLAALLT